MSDKYFQHLLEAAIGHHRAGRRADAERTYRQILAEHPKRDKALHLLSQFGRAVGQRDAEIGLLRQAIGTSPNVAEYHNDLGHALCLAGKYQDGAASFAAALKLKPDFAEAMNNLGIALAELGQAEKAEALFRQAIALEPEYVNALNNLANALRKKRDLEGAIEFYRKAIQLRPDEAEIRSNLVTVLYCGGKVEEAVSEARRAVELKPQLADAHNTLGCALEAGGLYEEAIAEYRLAIRCKPDYASGHQNLGMALLRQGKSEDGWTEHEWRLKSKDLSYTAIDSKPRWQGEAGDGKTILLNWEQGLGDMLQYIRYAPLVAQRGWRVLTLCQTGLDSLLKSNPDLGEILAWNAPRPAFDAYCPIGSLPYVFRDQPIPAPPYLKAEPERRERWRNRLGESDGRPRIGLVWAGNPAVETDRIRSTNLEQLAPLGQLRGVKFYTLQKGQPAEQANHPPAGLELTVLGPELMDLPDTAAVMSELDLILTTDTMPAHLAGALARPVWVMLHFAADFRYLVNREDSPWYPTMRLFRQKTFGDWAGVIERVAEAIGSHFGLKVDGEST